MEHQVLDKEQKKILNLLKKYKFLNRDVFTKNCNFLCILKSIPSDFLPANLSPGSLVQFLIIPAYSIAFSQVHLFYLLLLLLIIIIILSFNL